MLYASDSSTNHASQDPCARVISSHVDSGLGCVLTSASTISKCDISTGFISAGTLKLVPLECYCHHVRKPSLPLRMKRAAPAEAVPQSSRSSS